MQIREMQDKDFSYIFSMMREFYDSPAVICEVSDQVLKQNITHCINKFPYLDGYVVEYNGNIAGYAMLTKNYSTEAGGLTLWLEDLYIKPEYRGLGFGNAFFDYMEAKYKKQVARFRLEVEPENTAAINLYSKYGFKELSYMQMFKECK